MAGICFAQSRLDYDGKTISTIHFTGNTQFSQKDLEKLLTLKKAGIFNQKRIFSHRLLKQDIEAIRELYIGEGYLDILIIDSTRILENDKVFINLFVQEKHQYLLRQFTVVGNQKVSQDEIIKILDIRIDKPFQQYRYQNNLSVLADYYATKGMPYVSIRERINRNPDIIWEIDIQNEQDFFLRNIILPSTQSIRDKTIRRELTIQKGDMYNLNKLLRTRERIFDLGTFSNVNLIAVNPGKDSVDIRIDLNNSMWRVWDANIGVQQGRIEEVNQTYLFSQVDWLHKNIMHRAHRIGLTLNLNLLWDQLQMINSSKPSYNVEFRYTVPWLFLVRMETTFKLYYRKDVYSPFSETIIEKNDELLTQGLEISALFKYRKDFQIQVSTTFRQVESLLTLADNELQQKYGLSLYYDKRDNFLFPRTGWYIKQVSQIVRGLASQTSDYYQWDISATHYIPLFQESALAVRGEVGAIINNADTDPLYAMFRMGTENTVRGWSQSIGQPYYSSDSTLVFAGYNKIQFNAEYRFPIWNNYGGELFIDAGQLSDSFSKLTGINSYYISTGFGLTYKTFIGPVRLEIPFVLQDPEGSKKPGDRTEVSFILALLYAF